MQERVWVPGRVNLIGEHIDYHGLPVLPMALTRGVEVRFRPREDRRIRAVSSGYGEREFEWEPSLEPVASGDWENYLRAAALAVSQRWDAGFGVEAEVSSDLPAAAGLSSSSALLVAFTLCLLRANGWNASFEELMEVLPDGEQFVGTRGGGMDHAAILASRAGCASLVSFQPPAVQHVPIPKDWAFLVADSGVRAAKSGDARERYNAVRTAGAASHVASEAARVEAAVAAMEQGDAETFGRLLVESHASLRDTLKVSCEALDRLVDDAMEAGALGARLTGAGFGGCAVIFCRRQEAQTIRGKLSGRWLVTAAEPGPGALCPQKA